MLCLLSHGIYIKKRLQREEARVRSTSSPDSEEYVVIDEMTVEDYVVDIWEVRKIKLYGDDSSQSQSSTRDLGEFTGIEGQSGKNMCQGGLKIHDSGIMILITKCDSSLLILIPGHWSTFSL